MPSSQDYPRGRPFSPEAKPATETSQPSLADLAASRRRLSEALATIRRFEAQTPIERRLEMSSRCAAQMLEGLHAQMALADSSITRAWTHLEDLLETMDYVRKLRALRRDLGAREQNSVAKEDTALNPDEGGHPG